MHRKNMLHGDLKPDNFLVHRGIGVVSDFGHSLKMGTDSPQHGDEDYREPHIEQIDELCDRFSLILSFLDILAPEHWTHKCDKEQKKIIEDFRSYLEGAILDDDRHKRPTLEQLATKMDEVLDAAKKKGKFPGLEGGAKIVFRDYKTRDQIYSSLNQLPNFLD